MLHVVESAKPLPQVARDLEAAVARHRFGVLGVHDLKAKMAEKGVPFARECRIFEVCNPHQAKKVLEANLEISTALPCRISVYEEGGRTKLATIRPTAMIALYASPGLKEVAEDVEATLERIMADAPGRRPGVAILCRAGSGSMIPSMNGCPSSRTGGYCVRSTASSTTPCPRSARSHSAIC